MEDNKLLKYVTKVLDNMPTDWLQLTTHRLDIYNETLAKVQFLEQFEALFETDNFENNALSNLPTAYDYIRLGHPLSCVLEWAIAGLKHLDTENVISFASKTAPILAILRKNLLDNKNTQINFIGNLPPYLDQKVFQNIYGYKYELKQVKSAADVGKFDGSTLLITDQNGISDLQLNSNIDFYNAVDDKLGSVLLIHGSQNAQYIAEVQHVRRRETIAMTPSNCVLALKALCKMSYMVVNKGDEDQNKNLVLESIKKITTADTKALVASSGLSMQYAIVMGLIHDAMLRHEGKAIKIVVPPNCYGGTNDQARRIAACLDHVEVVDLPVDGGNNMVQSIDTILDAIATEDAVPLIIAEIPTNPRVEVPDLLQLEAVLSKKRTTRGQGTAIEPVFILDQTFCPNTHFLGEKDILATTPTIAYVSGSKFPSGGKCTAGYCVANKKAAHWMKFVDMHLRLCDNEATPLQMALLAEQLPSMNQRIQEAYQYTRDFVNFIHEVLPEAKINFVSEELAAQGFTPSVFSLDLPTKGNSDEEREAYKRELNLKLIHLMIGSIPNESKFCVSYGQLKGCYWTIPATSTQGTTKEGDKDYIVRVALSANLDFELHKKVFLQFVESI